MRGRPKVLNKAGKTVLKKARYKEGDNISLRENSHMVSKPSPRVMKSCEKCL